ncbi:uncharacterized protein BDZ99DRAFT_526106 [Mytilinidion resinicola]|uniref:Heterokaryon incompatibility domain-containing protein n=1 Tax=Mytilinidion resinicola TaxID=574789 RepID=A0A6A6Y8C5_9PEZI|nr:uncharacterized protein BDZ99DRAFT_526106 [Mytilinidion resinicola]KAF2804067.1 hypothetical protein BDZ99DRAFT_526106 [Mytilinidion resinicola]
MVIWLGDYPPQPRDGVMSVFMTAELLSKIPMDDFPGNNALQFSWNQIPSVYLEAVQKGSASLNELIGRDWFSHTWSLGDLASFNNSKAIKVVYGSISSTWDIFASAALRLRYTETDDCENLGTSRIRILYQVIAKNFWVSKYCDNENDHMARLARFFASVPKNGSAERVHSMLTKMCDGSFGARDPHDMIYSIVSLMRPDELPSNLQPDYAKPFTEVYWRYAVFLMTSIRDLGYLLCWKREIPILPEISGVPSWVPDFRYLVLGEDTPKGNLIIRQEKELELEGIQIGTVVADACTLKFSPYSSISELCTTLRSSLQKLDIIVKQSKRLGNLISYDAAIHRFLQFSRQYIERPYIMTGVENKALYYSLIDGKSSEFLQSVEHTAPLLSWMKEIHRFLIDLTVIFTEQDGNVQARFCTRLDASVQQDNIVCIFPSCISALLLRERDGKYLLISKCTSDTGEFVDQRSFTDAEKKRYVLI